MNKTKIICTIGPSSCEKKILRKLINSGMNVARLNASHKTLEWHATIIKRIRSIDKNIPILLDLPGRKIRTLISTSDFKLSKGEKVTITSNQRYRGKNKVVANYSGLHKDLKKGDIILADDGTLKFRVESIEGRDILCKALSKGVLKGGKGLNIPYIKLNTPLITKKDFEVLRFALKNDVDLIGVSFVESANHIRKIRRILRKNNIGIVPKIESQIAIENLDEICDEASALMIDRGDLSAETKIEHMALLQKAIITKANKHGKPVIVATEMLHSMIYSSQPTKAEINDISNSIIDGASGIMLSAETAIGENAVAAVRLMRAVANEVEKDSSVYDKIISPLKRTSIPNAIGRSIYEICKEMNINKVVCITRSGYAASMVSRYRIKPPILAVSDIAKKARSFNLLWGVEGISLKTRFYKHKSIHIIENAKKLWRLGKLLNSDVVAFTGVIFPKEGNKMNFVTIHKIGDLKDLFKWYK